VTKKELKDAEARLYEEFHEELSKEVSKENMKYFTKKFFRDWLVHAKATIQYGTNSETGVYEEYEDWSTEEAVDIFNRAIKHSNFYEYESGS